MISYLLVSTLGISVVFSTEYSYSVEQAEGEAGIWEILRVKISSAAKPDKTLCNRDVDDTTISVFCSLSGYTKNTRLLDSTHAWGGDLEVGYSAECTKWDLFQDCLISDVADCTKQLVFNCTDHYTSLLGDVTNTDILLPAILIPVIILYVLALFVLEFRQNKENEDQDVTREISMKTTTVTAFERTQSKKDGESC